MNTIHHINCGTLRVAGYPPVVCHALLLEDPAGLVLIDTGIGLLDVLDPPGRLGQPLIDLAGFQFHEVDTAVRRIEALGFSAQDVRHIVLTHADPDHAGGLADFPQAAVHISSEELSALEQGNPRYIAPHFAHGPRWQAVSAISANTRDWFGLPARELPLGTQSRVLLVPLFGHTLGHCGVAIEQAGRWLLHVGDAYYLLAELTDLQHPVGAFAELRAVDNTQRLASLEHLRRLHELTSPGGDHAGEIELLGYHDLSELPTHCQYGGK